MAGQIVFDPNKGLTLPTFTTAQKNNILTPNIGALVYDTTLGAVCEYTSGGWVTLTGQGSTITSASTQTASGPTIDFTNIPSWAKRITVMLNNVSTDSATGLYIQIGSGSFSTTGYTSQAWASTGSGIVTNSFIIVSSTVGSAYNLSGNIVLAMMGGNIWTSTGIIGFDNVTSTGFSSSGRSPTLSSALDRIRVLVGGSPPYNFDNGTINIFYE